MAEYFPRQILQNKLSNIEQSFNGASISLQLYSITKPHFSTPLSRYQRHKPVCSTRRLPLAEGLVRGTSPHCCLFQLFSWLRAAGVFKCQHYISDVDAMFDLSEWGTHTVCLLARTDGRTDGQISGRTDGRISSVTAYAFSYVNTHRLTHTHTHTHVHIHIHRHDLHVKTLFITSVN